MSFTERILFRFTDMLLKAEKGIELHGPLFLSNREHQELVTRAIAFRTKQNLARAPWLETPKQLELENGLMIDQRSAHFVATRGEEIVVCLRLTPGPFELSSLNPKLADREMTHKDFWEFGRLCTDLNLNNKGKTARLLLIRAGLWLFSQTEARGIVAVCRQDKLNYMSKFALYQEGTYVQVEGREGQYCFISAPRDKILSRFMKEFLGVGESGRAETTTDTTQQVS